MKSDNLIGQLCTICKSSYIFNLGDDFANRRTTNNEWCYVVGIRTEIITKSKKNFYAKVLTCTGIVEVNVSQLFESLNFNEP